MTAASTARRAPRGLRDAAVATALVAGALVAGACAEPRIGGAPAEAPDVDAGAAVCTVGEVFPCACPDGVGTAACLSPDGARSACGCPREGGADVLVPPPEPVVTTCGATSCAPYLEEATEVSARHCCTDAGACGSQASFLFGAACVARGADPGTPDAACPDESPNFVDLEGCCRPDGACGLSIDAVPNWDVGCIERTEMARLLNEGGLERFLLSLVFLLPYAPAGYEPIACDPTP